MKHSIISFIVLLTVQYGWSQGTGYWNLPSKSINGLNYFLFEETGEVMMADENCWDGELALPATINWDGQDYPLRYLASRAFSDCKALTRVTIPETVRDIRFYTDYLGDLSIIKSPFHGCTQLESIEVVEDNQWLCSLDGVLYNHEKTQLFNYPPGAARSHFAIPEGTEAIGTAAFRGSLNLTSVSIPNTVTRIYEEAFYECDHLEQISLPDNISTIRLSTFRGCSKLKSIHLPDSLKEIKNAAFYECSSLKEIVFPEKLQTLGAVVFYGCQLKTVVIKGYLYDYSISNLLPYLNDSTKLYVPASEVDRYKNIFSGEVLPLEEYTELVTFTAGQMATIVLPTEPDAGKGKYYRLDRVDGNEIVFEQELHPQAHVPYIIVPSEDFSIELSTLELAGLRSDTVSIEGISFIGTYQKEVIEEPDGFYIDIIDTTPDCSLVNDKQMIGALRAYLLVTWDDPYNHGGTKVPAEEMQIVLHDHGTGIETLSNSPSKGENIYNLNGIIVNSKSPNRKLPRGIYIKDGRKQLR